MPVKNSLKITAVISLFLVLVLVLFTCLLRWNLNKEKFRQLKSSVEKITVCIDENDSEIENAFFDLPYFINFSIFDMQENQLNSNNAFIPKLPDSNGKVVHHFVKNFYMDGNLDVLYLTQEYSGFFVQTAIDIETDSAAKMIYFLPFVIVLVMIPVSVLTFFVLNFFISRDFEREHAFSSNVSHELQTPVNAILGHANMLNRWGKDDKTQLETSLGIIISEAHLMKATITNLLQITKLEKKMVELKKEEFSVAEFFDSIKSEFKYEKNLEINYDSKIEEKIETDKSLFHQLFVIVISNSLKFSPTPCIIDIRFRLEGNKKIFGIEDNGSGFSKEVLPHIFERFYRGDEAHSRSKGGAGLGLSIAKSIANALDIKISARNSAKGSALIEFVI